jgi:hypothetical protein
VRDTRLLPPVPILYAAGLRKGRWLSCTITALLYALLTACGGDGGPLEPVATDNSITATVDGSPWNGSSTALAMRSSGFISVTGTVASNTYIAFAFPDGGPGTYSIPNAVGMNFNYGEYSTGRLWQALGMGTLGGVGAGSVTVTTLTAERVAGTFQFTAPAAASSGATGTRTITNGAFNVRY